MGHILRIYRFRIFKIGFILYRLISYHGSGVKNQWGLLFLFDARGTTVNGLLNYFLEMLKKKITTWFFEYAYIYRFSFIDLILSIDTEIHIGNKKYSNSNYKT